MSKARSPAYPAIGLKDAVEAVDKIYREDYQNPLPREVAAKHMGYSGLNGKSLGALSALLKYGLLEGRGNDTRVSDRAVAILAHEPGNVTRAEALAEAAASPELFVDLDLRFQSGKASDQAIRSYLIMQKFIPAAADNALRSYRDTKQLLSTESVVYNKQLPQGADTENNMPGSQETHTLKEAKEFFRDAPDDRMTRVHDKANAYLLGRREEKAALDEGEAQLILPEKLSAESVRDLTYWLEGILRKERRRSGLPQHLRDEDRAALIEAGIPPQMLENPTPEKVAMLLALITP